MMKKTMMKWMLAVVMLMTAGTMTAQTGSDRCVVAYVSSWTTQRLPDPTLMTHINYAFGHVTETFDGVRVQNPDFLRKVMTLKEQNPALKIVVSVGGWTSGNFSEMAATEKTRKSFAKDCRRIVDEYGLDGIDIDWEYPTSNEAGISCSPDDTENFTLLMRDLREAIGPDKLLSIATIADARFINFRDCVQYLDFVNIMAYDVANPPKHHTTLFRSDLSGRITVAEAVEAHLAAGVPKEKLLLGMPLYARGGHQDPILRQFMKTGELHGKYFRQWDDVGKVPYIVNEAGEMVLGYDNPVSLAYKCQYIIDMGLRGGMYWECTEDNDLLEGMRTIYQWLLMKH